MACKKDGHASVWQELLRDWRTLKRLHGKQRLEFLWDYYKWRVIACVCAIAAVSTFASILWEGQKPCRLRVCVALNTAADCSEWFSSFIGELQADGKAGTVDINFDQTFDCSSDFHQVQQLEIMSFVSSGQMDAAVCGEDMYRYLLELNACLPLDQGLPEELYKALSAEGKLVRGTAGLTEGHNIPAAPEERAEGYYAVDLTDSAFGELYNQTETGPEPLYAVIISNTEHLEECQRLIESLTET